MTNLYVDLLLDDSPIYEYSVSLEGNSYIIEMIYNERSSLYFMSLYDADRNPIVLSAALVPGYPIMFDYALPNLTGFFLLIQKGELASEPYKDFPDKLKQYYDFVYTYLTED
jgi:hypothetical protein